MIVEVKSKEPLSDFLRRSGQGVKSDCTHHKGCGKCRVKLLSGIWESAGKILCAPATAVACITHLKSCIGIVEIPENTCEAPQISGVWHSALSLPPCPAPVIAVDVGTTTLAAVRIENGSVTRSAGAFNGQIPFGDNTIDRIAKGEEAFPLLRQALLDSIEKLLVELDYKSVCRIGVAGNTVMNCFLHNISPASVGVYPFKAPQHLFPERRDLWDKVPVVTLPSLTGLLGGDITGTLFCAPLETGEMLIDLGTNCEILFRTPSGIFGTSAAAGPAFEGAGISSGSRAVSGAIDHYMSKGNFSVIGNSDPAGICGSALVDFLAIERASGNLSAFGRFVSGAVSEEIAPGVTVTEGDIAELLKAKAAVAAAVKTLEQHCGTKVKRVKLAGAFGRYLNMESAQKIGLLPAVPTELCGNLSLAGAAWAASAPRSLEEMAVLTEKIREIHLNEIPGFEGWFTQGLLLP